MKKVIPMVRKCTFGYGDYGKNRCKNDSEEIFRVQVFHPISGRTSWQTWYFCQEHFAQFLQMQGKDWVCVYNPKLNRPDSPVIDFKLEMII